MDTNPSQGEIITVSSELKPLIPLFLKNRTQEIQKMKTALEQYDYPDIIRIAHGFKGVCGSFGIEKGYTIAGEIEKLADIRAYSILNGTLNRLEIYIESLEIKYSEEISL